MGVIVEHSRSLYIGIKLCLALGVEGLIEILLPLIKAVFSEHDCPALYPEVFSRSSGILTASAQYP